MGNLRASTIDGCISIHYFIYYYKPNRPVSQLFSSSSEQPEQGVLAYKSEQQTAGCIAIFDKYFCYIKHGDIITNLTLWNHYVYITDMSKTRWEYMENGLEYITFYVEK